MNTVKMNKNYLPIFFIGFFALSIIFSCNEDSKDTNAPLTMDSGYKYYHYIQNEGPKPQAGEVAFYYITMRADDSLMLNGREAEMITKIMIPPPELTKGAKVSPTLEGIKLMSIGDSLRVFQPLDSIGKLPQGFEGYSNIVYDLVLFDIKSADENRRIDAEIKRKDQAAFMKRDSLSKLVLKDYTAGKLDDKIIEKPSGLKIYIHEEGSGAIPSKRRNRISSLPWYYCWRGYI